MMHCTDKIVYSGLSIQDTKSEPKHFSLKDFISSQMYILNIINFITLVPNLGVFITR